MSTNELIKSIKVDDLREASRLLFDGFQEIGFTTQAPRRGFVKSINFWSGTWYPISFIPNKTDLLFYIRKPALERKRKLHDLALQHHPGAVNVDQQGRPARNKAGETKIRIRSSQDAQRLLNWLRPELEPMVHR